MSWASKYGDRARGQFPGIVGSKSFLTPVDTVFPSNIPLSQTELERLQRNKAAEVFQRDNLYGFTTRELVDLDAITARSLNPPSLANPIIPPLLRWENVPPRQANGAPGSFYPIDYGFPGVWEASNPIVWNVIKPSLTLASQMLNSFHMLPWFDALFNGNVYPIDPSRLPPPIPGISPLAINSFHLQPSHLFNHNNIAQQRDDILEYMCGSTGGPRIRFGFCRSNDDPNRRTYDPGDYYGITQVWDVTKRKTPITVHINTRLVLSLLDQRLTAAERLGGQWFLANVILHEMTATVRENNTLYQPEPYFEDDNLAELGFSMEQSVFGGVPEPIGEHLNVPGGFPTFGYFLGTPFPSMCLLHACEQTVLKIPPVEQYVTFFPIKASFLEDVQQQSFWDVPVRQYGFNVFHKRILRAGAQMYFRDPKNHNTPIRHRSNGPLPFPWNEHQPSPSPQDLLNMSPAERKSGEYVRQLVEAAKNEDKFYESSKSMQNQANRVLETVKKYGPSTPAIWEQNRFLRQGIQHHISATKALLAFEQASNNIVYTDRRANLLRWNVGIRAFIRQLTGESEVDELIDLEYARMSLTDPSTTPSAMNEIAWLQSAINAYLTQDYMGCLQLCNRILADPSCSLFLVSGTNIVAAMLSSVRPSLEARATDLDIGFSCLQRIRGVPGGNQCPVLWLPHVQTWMNTATELQKELHKEYTAAEAAARNAAAGQSAPGQS